MKKETFSNVSSNINLLSLKNDTYKRQLTWLLHENTCQKSFFRIVQSELQSLEFFLPLTLKHIIALELEPFYCNVEQEVGEGQESLIKFTDELVFFSKWEQARDFFTFFLQPLQKIEIFFRLASQSRIGHIYVYIYSAASAEQDNTQGF